MRSLSISKKKNVSVFFGIPPTLLLVSLVCVLAYGNEILQDVALHVSQIEGGGSRDSHCASTDSGALDLKYAVSIPKRVTFLAGY